PQFLEQASLQERALERRELPAAVPQVHLGHVHELDGIHRAAALDAEMTESTELSRHGDTETQRRQIRATGPRSVDRARVLSVSLCLCVSVANSLRVLPRLCALITRPRQTNPAGDRRTSRRPERA